jgi:intracellular sulfur oxidation DsrE/DsrF family protein
MRRLFILTLLILSFSYGETEFAEPKPSMENPRKFVFPMTKWDRNEIKHILGSTNNVMKFYGVDNVEVVIVAYSQGIKALLKRGNVNIKKRVKSLMTYDVEFIACGNTMRTLKIDKEDLIEGVEVVTAGIVELIERQLRGYIYIRP